MVTCEADTLRKSSVTPHEYIFKYFFTYFIESDRLLYPSAYRADWFLLDTRAVRHVAVGLFCFGVSVFLAGRTII